MAQKYVKIPPFGTVKYDNGSYPKGYDTDAPISIGEPVDETDAAQQQSVIDIERIIFMLRSRGEESFNIKQDVVTLTTTVGNNLEEAKRYSLITRGR